MKVTRGHAHNPRLPALHDSPVKLVAIVLRAWGVEGGREGEGDTNLLNNCGASQIKSFKSIPRRYKNLALWAWKKLIFKLYKTYQKEEEKLDPFKNSRTALQKKLKITGVLVKKKIIIIKIENIKHLLRVAESYFVGMAEIHFNPWEIPKGGDTPL